MTLNGWLQIVFMLALVVVTARPLGIYMAAVFEGRRTWLNPILRPVERGFYALAGVDEKREQGWLGYAIALLAFNAAGFVLLYAILRLQHLLPWNPAGLGPMSEHLAFNTATSFVSNTNWQSYGGESTLSYFSQMVGLTTQNFVSAATGIAVVIPLARAFSRAKIGHGRQFLGRSHPHHALCAATDLDRRRTRTHRTRHAAESRRLCRCGDARRRQAGARARAGRQPDRDQAARHQWRRLLQRKLRASLRESERLDQHDPALGDSRHLARPRHHLRPHDRQGAAGLGAAFGDDAVHGGRLCRRLLGRSLRQSADAGARRRRRQYGGQGSPLRHRALDYLGDVHDRRLQRLGQLHAQLLHAARRPGAAGADADRRDRAGRRRLGALRDRGVRGAGDVRRRPDGRPHARISRQEARGQGSEDGDARRPHHADLHSRLHRGLSRAAGRARRAREPGTARLHRNPLCVLVGRRK